MEVLKELSHQQTKELLVESFGEENSRYHTLDEIPLYKLINKLQKPRCPNCEKEFVPNIEGGKEINSAWFCLDCIWNQSEDELSINDCQEQKKEVKQK